LRELVPYIGICDFTNFGQVQEMLEVFQANLPDGMNRKLMVGVMMSHKTLHDIPSKWADIFPKKRDVASIFDSEATLNCLHFVVNEEDSHELWRDMAIALNPHCGLYIHAIQLDRAIWPDPGQIANGVHTARYDDLIEVILQINGSALDEVGNQPSELVEKLRDYETVIQRVLLDKSMGRGLPLNPEELAPYIRAIMQDLPWLKVSIAGGLGPDTLDAIKPLVAEFPDLSIDAQSKLRPSGNAMDPIDWEMAKTYLVKALEIFT